MLYALTPCILLFSINALNAKPDLLKAYKEGLSFAENKLKENHAILKPRVGVCQKTTQEDDILKCLKGEKGHAFKGEAEARRDEQQGHKGAKIYVFVSFSMPTQSLNALLKEAPHHNAVLVLRGLKNNSFKETAHILQEFYANQKEDIAGFEINPELFEKYNITHVPVFFNTSNHKRLSGNVTLSYASLKLKEETPS